MILRRSTQVLLSAGVAVELLLALFPPMRFTLAPGDNQLALGRTRHFFVLSNIGGAWTIDIGRFVVYAFLIATLTLALVAIESWFRTGGARNP